MTVYDFINLMTDDGGIIAIFDMATGEEVYYGPARDAMFDDYSDYEVLSFDLDGEDPRGPVLVLNIETEEDD